MSEEDSEDEEDSDKQEEEIEGFATKKRICTEWGHIKAIEDEYPSSDTDENEEQIQM